LPVSKTLIRAGDGPLLTRDHIPGLDPSGVFNPGAVLVEGKTFLMLRVQTRGRRTFCIPAFSDDGFNFIVAEKFTEFVGLPDLKVFHNYDARLTMLDNQLMVITALDTDQGCRCALWKAAGNQAHGFAGLERLEFISLVGEQDTRNAVLFPEKIGGQYTILHRPNQTSLEGGPVSGSAIHLCVSDDLQSWQDQGAVMSGNFHFWDELIGSGPPPIKTKAGWLHLYHGVATHFQSANIYQAGAVLLDLDHPAKVLARTRDNILEPRESWELNGQVPNVVFPSGATVSYTDHEGFAPDEAILHVYYGAADTVVALAQNTVGAIIAACDTASS